MPKILPEPVFGILLSIAQLRSLCEDVVEKNDTDKPDAMAMFMSCLINNLKGIEGQVDALLKPYTRRLNNTGSDEVPRAPARSSVITHPR